MMKILAGYESPTGGTLRANNLEAVEEVAQISSRLIVNQASLKTRSAKLQPLIEAFARAYLGRES